MRYPIIISCIFLLACGNTQKPTEKIIENDKTSTNPPDTSWKDSDENIKYYSYNGLLPCKDCDGIETTFRITLAQDSFELIETLLENNFQDQRVTFVSKGNLNTERGYENDPDATVYILRWNEPKNRQRIFVRLTGKDNEVFEIGLDRKKFTDGKNHILKKTE